MGQKKHHEEKSVLICEICGTKKHHEEKSALSVKSVGQKNTTKKNLRYLRNLRDKKIIAAHIGRQPLVRGQISAEIRE